MYSQEISIPKEVKVEIDGMKVKVIGPKGQLEKEFKTTYDIKIEKNERIKVFSEDDRRKVRAMIGTIVAHIRNMIDGTTKGFTYILRAVYSHFPITVKVESGKVIIQNFLGERKPRVAKIVGDTDVKVSGSEIIVSGIDLEKVSQTAANIEQATRITGYDRRRFMDGIYIVSKGE